MSALRVTGFCGIAVLLTGLWASPILAGHPAAWSRQHPASHYGSQVRHLAQDEVAARRQLIDYTNAQRRQLRDWFQHAIHCSPHDRGAVARQYARQLQAVNRGFVHENVGLSRYYGDVRDHARDGYLDRLDHLRTGYRYGYPLHGPVHGF